MSHSVFLVASIGAPRNHHAIFVETDPSSRGGIVLQVTGNIQAGMEFEERHAENPETADGFVGKTCLGEVKVGDLDRLREICRRNPAPKKQFDVPRRLYPTEALRRCQEWTAETIELLSKEGVLLVSGSAGAQAPVKESE